MRIMLFFSDELRKKEKLGRQKMERRRQESSCSNETVESLVPCDQEKVVLR